MIRTSVFALFHEIWNPGENIQDMVQFVWEQLEIKK